MTWHGRAPHGRALPGSIEVYAGLDDYATYTEREFPVVLLEPTD